MSKEQCPCVESHFKGNIHAECYRNEEHNCHERQCECDCHYAPEDAPKEPVSPVKTIEWLYLVVALNDLNIVRYQRLFKDLDEAYDCGMKWRHKFKDRDLDIEIQVLSLGETAIDDYRVATWDTIED